MLFCITLGTLGKDFIWIKQHVNTCSMFDLINNNNNFLLTLYKNTYTHIENTLFFEGCWPAEIIVKIKDKGHKY